MHLAGMLSRDCIVNAIWRICNESSPALTGGPWDFRRSNKELSMNEKTIELDIPLLAPQITDGQDGCLDHLVTALQYHKGILYAHVERDKLPARLCIHYDPNLVSLAAVQCMATEAGGAFSARYRHEQIPVAHIDAADVAATLARQLETLPGMLHASVNYAAGPRGRLAFVAYDHDRLQRPAIERLIRGMGVKVLASVDARSASQAAESQATDSPAAHDHGNAPVFLPDWMQERWSLLLVALAGGLLLSGWVGEHVLGLPSQLALAFYLLAYMAGGYDVATHAIPGVLKGKFDTDVLMLAAATGAALLGEWAEGAFLLFLFALGHAGEHYALARARNAVNALGALMPKTALLKRDGQLVVAPVASVQVGDVVIVRPGDRVPVDGEITGGQSALDQSAVTGESVPVDKEPGDEVFAGTINQTGSLEVSVTRLAQDNTLSRVMQMVAEAQNQQSPTQQFTQRFTAWFVPTILTIAGLVMVIPPLLGWMSMNASFYRAMLLLIAASPCALAIGTPAAVLAGIAQAARNGILIKGGVHLENLGTLYGMAFDKTGTLTAGKFAVTDVIALHNHTPQELLTIAAAVEQHSTHPLAQAIVRAAQLQKFVLPAVKGIENVPGRGVLSEVAGQPVLIGSRKFVIEFSGQPLDQSVSQMIDRLEAAGRSTMIVSLNGVVIGVLGMADQLRPHVGETMAKLRMLGIRRLVMLTGDTWAVARQIAQAAGIDDVRGELLPEDKVKAIQDLQRQYGRVAMTGDGVNDAPALAAATVGITLGGAGAAVALETADVALMGNDIGKLPFAVGLSRASSAIIRQNLAISLAVVGILIATSVLGWVQLSGAIVLHEGSTILVVLNALRLLKHRLD
jgi:Cd2+/Zn2+-exporting ATPase